MPKISKPHFKEFDENRLFSNVYVNQTPLTGVKNYNNDYQYLYMQICSPKDPSDLEEQYYYRYVLEEHKVCF